MENNNFQALFKNNNYIAFVLFYLIILIQSFLFTSFGTFFPYNSVMLSKLVNLLIVFYVIYGIMIQLTIRKIIYTLVILLIVLLTFWKLRIFSPYIKLLLLSIAVPATIPSGKKIAGIFSSALVTTMVTTIVFSLLGYLPQSGTMSKSIFSNYQETVYFLGFSHPNAFGTFLSMIFASFMFLFYKKHKWIMVMIALATFVINVAIGAGTAATATLLIFIISIIPIKLYKITYLLPLALATFALWLSYDNNSALGVIINEKIASRPNVWNAYTSQYPIKLISDPIQVNTDGYFGILGNGVLDGSYIYVLIFWGILALIVYIVIFMVLIKFSIDTKNKVLFAIAVMIIVSAFPESHMIMFYENIFLLFIGFYQYPMDERNKYLQS
ncbi:hypothetical protein KIJ04_04555 [Leuconostoc gelidum subsp. gelidum]|uniref:hypothetical protein n=1 Tax=Leuconostoc gelidum TaxID=1244 RepID=UPI001CC38F77|nr:hypothetical protein [Leuconostoc gelidum]MBZ6014016.1 hypothetical protein [Leuconostoc gelidum subsp. gelidum]